MAAAKRKRDEDDNGMDGGIGVVGRVDGGVAGATGASTGSLYSKQTKTLDRELDKFRRPLRVVKFGARSTVRVYGPSAVEPIDVPVNELFRPDQMVALLFEGLVDGDSDPQTDIVDMPRFREAGAVVSTKYTDALRRKRPGITHIEDPTGVLAREFRVLDPLGGGCSPAAAAVFVSSGMLLGVVPLQAVPRRRAPEIIGRFLSREAPDSPIPVRSH